LSDNDIEVHNAASNCSEKMLKLFVMLINITTLILKVRSQRGARAPSQSNVASHC